MKPSSELTERERRIELLRWISVLPAVVLGGFVASIISDVVIGLASPDGILRILITEFPKGSAIVIAGAKTAPRRRALTAMVLTGLWILLAVIIHVLLRGPLGWTNYMGAGIAAVAAASAAVFIYAQERK